MRTSTAGQLYRNKWNTTNTIMPNAMSVGKKDGNTTRTSCGVGRIGTTMSALRYVTQMNSGWTSVALVWALALTLLTSKQHRRCRRVVFTNLDTLEILSQSVHALALVQNVHAHVFKGYKQTNMRHMDSTSTCSQRQLANEHVNSYAFHNYTGNNIRTGCA